MKNCVYIVVFLMLGLNELTFAANYYVNDNSVNGDIYCSAIGSLGNDGLSAGTPKSTLTAIWSSYGPSGSNSILAGDTIFVDAGLYYQTDVNLYFDVAIVVQGAGMEKTIFDNDDAGLGTGYAFARLGAGVHFSDFQIYRYRLDNTYASAIEVEAGVTSVEINYVHINDCGHTTGSYPVEIYSGAQVSFTGGGLTCNSWLQSGGVRIEGSTTLVSFDDYVFYGNSRGYDDGAALRMENGTVEIRNSLFEKNRCNNGGVSILYQAAGDLSIYDTKFDGNEYLYSFNEYGGTILVNGGTFYMTRSIVSNTTRVGGSFAYGAGVCFDGTSSLNTISATIDSCYFFSNTGDRGNDLHAQRSNTTVNVYKTIFGSAANQVGTRNSSVVNLTNSGNPSLYAGGGTVNKINTIISNYTANPVVADYQGDCAAGTIILPVELSAFDGKCTDKGNELMWQTTSEYNNAFFIVERAGADGKFELIEQTPGSLNSSDLLTYYYFDEHPKLGVNYYRLSQVDVDGRSESFAPITVYNNCNNDDLVISYVDRENALYFSQELEDVSTVSLYTLSGGLVQVVSVDPKDQFERIMLNTPPESGMYLVKINRINSVETAKVLITK